MGFLLKLVTVLVVGLAVLVGLVMVNIPKGPYDMTYPLPGRLHSAIIRITEKMLNLLPPLGLNTMSIIRILVTVDIRVKDLFRNNTDVKIREEVFDGVSVRVYDPVYRKTGGPAIMFFHGGGWVLGDTKVYHHPVLTIARKTGFLVVSVDYRLAPEHRYPAALLDCETATHFLITYHKRYNIHPKRIALVGDDAGGNLVAAVSLSMRNKNRAIMPKLQVPIYPILQGLDFNLPSYQNETGIVLQASDVYFFIMSYLMGANPEHMSPEIIEKARTNRLHSASVWVKHVHKISHKMLPKANFHDDFVKVNVPINNIGFSKELDNLVVEPTFSPLMTENLKKLPPALFITCQYDVLRDDSFLYISRLRKAGVKVEHFHDERCYHGAVVTLVDEHPLLLKACAYLKKNL